MSTGAELIPLNATDISLAADVERARFQPVMNISQGLERRNFVVEAFQKLMKADEDYGVIPGSKKPTLLQPGAQKLDNLFGLVPRFHIIEKEEDWTGERHNGEPFFRYLVACQLYRGDFIMGESAGECNSFEAKYRYRITERKCPDCGVASIIQTKHKTGTETGNPKNFWCAPFKGGCGKGFKLDDPAITEQKTGRSPNPEIFDQVNTLLKMAQKRAHITATINATSASEFFTVDIEDQQKETPAETSSEPETPSRPIPDELKLAVERFDSDSIKAAWKMLEDELVANGGEAGMSVWREMTGKLRVSFPKGATIPKTQIVNCWLDLWAEIEKAKAAKQADLWNNPNITDDDLPPILGGGAK